MLRVRWNRFALVGSKPGELVDVGLSSEVVWRIENGTLMREETLSAKQPVSIRRWRLVVPVTYTVVETEQKNGVRTDRFKSNEDSLEVRMLSATFPLITSIVATGDSPLGRGVHGAIPLHLVFESQNVALQPDRPLKCRLAVTPHISIYDGK